MPFNYHLNNFNDFFSGLVTLFTLMVVNNWMVTVELLCTIKGSNFYRFYFILFYYFSVMIGINIIMAFILDVYSSVEKQAEDREKTIEMIEREFKIKRAKTALTDGIKDRFTSSASSDAPETDLLQVPKFISNI